MQKIFIAATCIASLLLVAFITGCQQNTSEQPPQTMSTSGHAVVVDEILQANAYTYLNVSENGQSFWIAVTKGNFSKGQKLYYDGGLQMTNFESKDLNRTFETIYFVDQISDQPMATMTMPQTTPGDMAGGMTGGNMEQQQPGRPAIEKLEISVPPAAGGITIADLYAKRNEYQNKVVKVRGQVTNVNTGIMGRNWIHIQDGTGSSNDYDLTITTNDQVSVGDIVTFEGTVSLAKDFGAGYFYDVIVEQGALVGEQAS